MSTFPPHPRTCDDLRFVGRDASGQRLPWCPRHGADTRAGATRYGLLCARELARLARRNAGAARAALVAALLAPTWDGDCGEEAGFATGVARAAVEGWRRAPAPSDEARDAEWQAL